MTSKKRINRDHAKKKNRPQVENEAIANYLEDLLIPAMAAQKTFYCQLNLRDRILTLPLMMAAILSCKDSGLKLGNKRRHQKVTRMGR